MLKSVYGVSAGSIVSAILLLDIEKNVIYDFIIKRPWNKIFNINSELLFKLVDEKGLLDNTLFVDNYTKTNFFIFGTKLNNLESVKISHETHPNMTLIDAITISSALPLIFKPVFYEGEYYIDGGVRKHFPIKTAINDGCNKNETLGLYIKRNEDCKITQDSSFIQYYYQLIIGTVNLINKDIEDVPFVINHFCEKLGKDSDILSNHVKRENMLKKGEVAVTDFLNENEINLESCVEEFAK
jgi:predicted patatin/cPLA2 family phospholipase